VSIDPGCSCCPPAPVGAPSSATNPPGLEAIAFRLATQSIFRQWMIERIGADPALAPLTTRAEDDPSIALLDAWAVVLDVLTFYQERIANEGYLRTAIERRSILELARAIGYELRPGVAASTEFAFTLDTSPGAPPSSQIDAWTKVQSVPAQNQKPQIFETLQAFTAYADWSALTVPGARRVLPLARGRRTLFLDGIATRLQSGDAVLIVGDERARDPASGRWDFRRVTAVRAVPPADNATANPNGYTVVRLDRGLGGPGAHELPAQKNARIFALRTRASFFGHNAPDWRTMPLNVRCEYLGIDPGALSSSSVPSETEVASYPGWPGFSALGLSDPPGGSGAGSGLAATYYGGVNFEQKLLTRIDPTVSFHWNSGAPGDTGSPDPGVVPITNFSARWEGWLEAPADGAYTFTVTSDDGSRLWIDGQLVVDMWQLQAATGSPSGPIFLQGSRKYPLRLEYFQGPGASSVELQWTTPGSTAAVDIPTSQLYPPVASTLLLDAVYPKIALGSWIVLEVPANRQLFQVAAVRETAYANFAMSAKVTWVQLAEPDVYAEFDLHLRDTTVFAESDELAWAEEPVAFLKNPAVLTLTTYAPGLASGQRLAVSGYVPDPAANAIIQRLRHGEALDVLTVKSDGTSALVRFHADSADLELPLNPAACMATIQSVATVGGATELTLLEPLEPAFILSSIRINANIAAATHGDSRQMRKQPEVLGSGDGSATFAAFQLKQSPVTYTSSSDPSGARSSLTVSVDDIAWKETPSLLNAGKTDRLYTARIADDASLTVRFGDGITGARLPSGVENVTAVYRVGIGSAGNLDAGQLTLLLTPQLGVKSVVNPMPALGGVDPETQDRARQNAPLTVLTLDRIVSLDDFQYFAAAFAGIGKAQAVWLWNGEQQVVAVTVAAVDGGTLSDTVQSHLQGAMDAARPPHQAMVVLSGQIIPLTVSAAIRVVDGYDFKVVGPAVTSALTQAFGFAARSFSQPVSASEMVAAMQKVDGVDYVFFEQVRAGADVATLTSDPLGAQGAQYVNGVLTGAQLLLLDSTGVSITEIGT